MKSHVPSRRKGQSAIEYLMTYGWMLLVVAIVGGAIFATVQGQCLEQPSGFESAQVAVADFEIGNNLQLEVSNNAGQTVTLQTVYVGNDAVSVGTDINNGESTIVDITSITSQEGVCNDFDVALQYQRGDFDPANSTGTVTGPMTQ
jgi:hypothetical protein